MDKTEIEGTKLGIILLDWEKAFDKITHSSLLKTLKRYRNPDKLTSLVQPLFAILPSSSPTMKENQRRNGKTPAYAKGAHSLHTSSISS